MDIYLVRHGEAKLETEDSQRPLSERGCQQARAVAAALGERGIEVFQILHSGKLRARQTAEILAERLHPSGGVAQSPGLNPEDDPALAETDLETTTEAVMLVGHLPHLAHLATRLLGDTTAATSLEFPPAAVLCLTRLGQRWQKKWMLTPELLSSRS